MTEINGLLAAGMVGAVVFVVVFLVVGATRPGYRPTYHLVSALALGPADGCRKPTSLSAAS
jgi:hypothetical protein